MSSKIFHSVLLWLFALSALAQAPGPAGQSQESQSDPGQLPSSQTLVLPPSAPGQTAPSQTLVLPPSNPPQMQTLPQMPQLQPPQGSATPPVSPQVQAPPPPPVGKIYAIRASGAVPLKLNLDEKLKPVAAALETLPFTTYESISINENPLPWGQETLFPINALYAMHVTALAPEADGAIALRTRVEMLQGETYVNAIKADAHAVQNQALLFRGLPLGNDELVIVLLVGMPQDGQNQGDSAEDDPSSSEGEQKSEDQSEQNTDDRKEGEEEMQEGEHAEAQQADVSEPDEGEPKQPEGVENLEALLESLDDTDRREQVEERNRRDRIDFKGDWW